MFGRIVELDATQERSGYLVTEHLLKAGAKMRVEVFKNQVNLRGWRKLPSPVGIRIPQSPPSCDAQSLPRFAIPPWVRRPRGIPGGGFQGHNTNFAWTFSVTGPRVRSLPVQDPLSAGDRSHQGQSPSRVHRRIVRCNSMRLGIDLTQNGGTNVGQRSRAL